MEVEYRLSNYYFFFVTSGQEIENPLFYFIFFAFMAFGDFSLYFKIIK